MPNDCEKSELSGTFPNISEDEQEHLGHREHVRKRFLHGGLEVFAPHEILELILYYAVPQHDTNPIAHRLLRKYGSLGNVLNVPTEKLRTMDGMGTHSARLLSLVAETGRRTRPKDSLYAQTQRKENMPSSADRDTLLKYFSGIFSEIGNEYAVFEICLNRKSEIVLCKRMSHGNIISVALNIRSLIANAIFNNSERIVIVHNHLDDTEIPSAEECIAFERIRGALDAVHINLHEYLILSPHSGDFAAIADLENRK